MHDKLLLLHKFLNKITHIENEDELTELFQRYRDKLDLTEEEEVIDQLLQDAQTLGKEMLALKSNATVAARNKKLAALTEEERTELAEVERIIDENRFCYHFQPIVSTLDGSIFSYEALMRPESDMGLTPFHILKYAELLGRLGDIERVTFLNVLSIIDSNKDSFKGRRVFINSIPQIKLNGSDMRRVGELLVKHSDTVIVELTEQAEFDEDELTELQERYQNMGINIAIDDYGTGYSNVQNLLRYMPSYVKIDHSLISDIQNSPQKRHFVREIVEFCHGTGIMALAEGVETSEELHTVVLLGVDLIQGFYAARPASEAIDSIPYEIEQEIRIYQQERQDGKDQQVYVAEDGERVQLDRLVSEDYQCVFAGKGDREDCEITIVGSPALDTEIHIEVAKDFRGRIMLENVHLSNVKNRPCINLNENSDVTLVLNGENKLDKGGIRVPEGARFTLAGEGILDIKVDGAEYFGIGNDISSSHGDLVFKQMGIVNINASGKEGVCIGSGQGGNITIDQGKIVLNIKGNTGVGIGALYADSKIEARNCAFNIDLSLMKGVGVGSLTGSTNVSIQKSSPKINMSGEKAIAIGTLGGEKAEVLINDSLAIINARGFSCASVGSLDGNTDFKMENASFQAVIGGEIGLPFGGLSGDVKVSLINADTSVKMETGADIVSYLSSKHIETVNGRTNFSYNGNVIDL